MKKNLRKMKNDGNLISGDFRKLKNTIKILQKNSEIRMEKEMLSIIPILRNLKFFKEKRPMSDEELLWVCYNVKYLKKEPGDIIFK